MPEKLFQSSQFCLITTSNDKLHLCDDTHGKPGAMLKLLEIVNGLTKTAAGIDEDIRVNNSEPCHSLSPILVLVQYGPMRCYPPCLGDHTICR